MPDSLTHTEAVTSLSNYHKIEKDKSVIQYHVQDLSYMVKH